MLFNSLHYIVFLSAVVLLFYTLPSSLKKLLLLLASYYFYMYWNAKFVALLLTLTVLDYGLGIGLGKLTNESKTKRKLLLVVSVAANLGFLGFFKYYLFLGGIAAQLLKMPAGSFALDIVLPIGISFHTFQSISYVVDVYRNTQKPITNLIDYGLYISFFPQLVAGPIVRARDFFADLYNWQPPSREDWQRGVLGIILGLTKKMALADQFAIVSDAYFKDPGAHPGFLSAWTAVFAFAMQIYFDFSGYTDIAIGSAKLFGFHFPVNFRRPYLATSITEFWRRWHISLSSWLRDYLYIPLGGNRGGTLMTYRNLILTMALGGLWHGASWNFVIWGGYHGVLLSAERLGRQKQTGIPSRNILRVLKIALTFVLVSIGWVFFRAADLPSSLYVLGQMVTPGGTPLVTWWQGGLVVIALTGAILEEQREWFESVATGPAWAYVCVTATMLVTIELFGITEITVPFVYFQF